MAFTGTNRYAVEFKTIHGEWFEESDFASLADAKAEKQFHENVTRQADYGARIRDRDADLIVA